MTLRIARALAVAALLAAVTALVYYSGGARSAGVHFYYVPIILAAVWFGDLGGIIAAVLAAFLCGPHMPQQISPYQRQGFAEILVRSSFFYIVAVVTSRLSTRLEARAREFASLYEVSRAVSSSLRLEEVLNSIAATVVEVCGAKGCILRLLDQTSGVLKLAASYGLSDDYLQKGEVVVSESPVDEAALRGQPVQIGVAGQSPDFQYPDAAAREGVISVLTVPLRNKEHPLGVFRVYFAVKRRFRPQEIALISTFAGQAAVAIENASLYDDIRRGYYETVRALTLAIEAMDPPTVGHSERVTEHLLQMASIMALPPQESETLRFAGMLHDIGKIGAPAAVYPDPELARINRLPSLDMHTLVGRTILSPVQFLRPVIPVILHHHENMDGSGYPEGLAGKDIPLLARMLRIACEYDILTSDMAGPGCAVSHQQAMSYLCEKAGTWFDPELVGVFAQAVREPGLESTQPQMISQRLEQGGLISRGLG